MTYQASQEVEDDVEYHRRHKLYRYVGNNARQCFGEGMDECIGSLFFNDRPLVVERVDFSNTDEGVHQDSEEKRSAFALEASRGIGSSAKEVRIL